MKLKVLVDNNTYIDEYYLGEPAVSYYLEAERCNILFDTGYSDIFIKNAEDMSVDLNTVTHIVLSHGHNDHSNGLKYLSKSFNMSDMRLITHPNCFLPKMYGEEYIGAPFSEKEISGLCRYTPSAEPYAVSENCIFLGEIPELNKFEKRPKIGTVLMDNAEEDDYVRDDSALVCDTPAGLFIITGCSHSGICNIMEYAQKVCGRKKIAAVLGGFHLFETDGRSEKTVDYLKRADVNVLYPCHCVSLEVKAEMMKSLNVREVGVGMTLEF